MKTINVDLSSGEALNLLVGRQGESSVTQVVFDFSTLQTEFGTGTVSLSVKRPKEFTPYAQTITTDGTDATWLVNETDTGVAGCGEIQLTYTVNSQIAKTVVYKYTVYPSIGVDGEYPIPGQTWQQEIEEDISEIREDLSDLQAEIEGSGSGMSTAFKQALHNILEKVAYIDDDGQTYLDALDDAMYAVTAIQLNTNSLSFGSLNSTQQLTATTTPEGGNVTWTSSNTSIATVSPTGLVTSVGYGSATITATSGSVSATCSVVVAQATLSSISAVYTQSGTVYDSDSLDSLKADLVVTARWSNSTTSTVADSDYTLTGTLAVGTSTITVSYGGKTDTFTVTVTERGALYPLKNGTWDTGEENPIYRITITNGNHIKFESLRAVSQQIFANLHDGGMSTSADIINNLPELFVIPANTETTLTISNVVNSGGVSFNCNFRKANANASSSFGIGDGTHTDGAVVTKTLTADESVSCLFFYHVQAIAAVGSVIEFDVSLFVGGTRYI